MPITISAMGFRTLFLLLMCNLVWSAHPVLSKFVLRDFGASDAAWLRYVSAFLAYLLFAFFARSRKAFVLPRGKSDWVLIPLLGVLTFCYSPLLQMTGLNASRAIDGALITAMEPLFAVVLAWVFLRERLRAHQVVAFVIALLGFALLADLGSVMTSGWAGGLTGHSVGSMIILASILGEAAYSVLGKKLLNRHAALPLFGSALGIGVVFLTLFAFLHSGEAVPDMTRFTWVSALAVLWLGPLGTMAGYLYWMTALKRASVAAVVITLFVQPVFGSLWGVLFLSESLTFAQAIGGGLILAAVFGRPGFILMRTRLRRGVSTSAAQKDTPSDIATQ